MSEVAEIYSVLRTNSRKKRASNREWSANRLTELGVEFESKNNGAHLVVKMDICKEGLSHSARLIDFWPGTGLWKTRSGLQGRGINGLLQVLGVICVDNIT